MGDMGIREKLVSAWVDGRIDADEAKAIEQAIKTTPETDMMDVARVALKHVTIKSMVDVLSAPLQGPPSGPNFLMVSIIAEAAKADGVLNAVEERQLYRLGQALAERTTSFPASEGAKILEAMRLPRTDGSQPIPAKNAQPMKDGQKHGTWVETIEDMHRHPAIRVTVWERGVQQSESTFTVTGRVMQKVPLPGGGEQFSKKEISGTTRTFSIDASGKATARSVVTPKGTHSMRLIAGTTDLYESEVRRKDGTMWAAGRVLVGESAIYAEADVYMTKQLSPLRVGEWRFFNAAGKLTKAVAYTQHADKAP